MPTIKMPNGQVAFSAGSPAGAARDEKLLQARWDFSRTYAKSKGWPEDLEKLTIDQIVEIRKQAGWQDPLREQN